MCSRQQSYRNVRPFCTLSPSEVHSDPGMRLVCSYTHTFGTDNITSSLRANQRQQSLIFQEFWERLLSDLTVPGILPSTERCSTQKVEACTRGTLGTRVLLFTVIYHQPTDPKLSVK